MIFLRYLFKNLTRHKLRTTLTILGIATAILSFGLLRTIVNAWYAGVSSASTKRLITRNAISLAFFLPISYKDKIKQVDGVTKVTYANWFGGVYISEKNFFFNAGVDANTYLDLIPEFIISEEELINFKKDRKSAIVGKKLAQRFGWKLGDNVTLKGTIYPGNWDFVIKGIYKGRDKNTDETQFLFHFDYLNEFMKKKFPHRADLVGWFIVEIEKPEISAEVSLNIDKLFKNSLAETLTETEKAFQLGFVSMTEAIVSAIEVISYLVIFIILAITANTMVMSARERSKEYAVMLTLGFNIKKIGLFIFLEALIISFLGVMVGIFFTYPSAYYFGKIMEAYFPIFNVPPKIIYVDIILAVLVSLFASFFPILRIRKIKVYDALRWVG
ncbi:MAG: FtsX-like permease family protein [Proteobacteria bacterium]|nr:FtsX-like permease family protein [Pseudomonadota bacterium]